MCGGPALASGIEIVEETEEQAGGVGSPEPPPPLKPPPQGQGGLMSGQGLLAPRAEGSY